MTLQDVLKISSIGIASIIWLFLFTACNEDCKPPTLEYCVIRSGDLYCINKNLREGRQKYTKDFWDARKYICASPDSFERLRRAWDKLCERAGNCKSFEDVLLESY